LAVIKFVFKEFRASCFKNPLKDIKRKYKNSDDFIESELQNSLKDPQSADSWSGMAGGKVKKLRVGLPKSKIGKSKGLRVGFIIDETRETVIFLTVYSKSEINNEVKIRQNLKDSLKTASKEYKQALKPD
jgi:hypothetical protein